MTSKARAAINIDRNVRKLDLTSIDNALEKNITECLRKSHNECN